MPEKPSVLFVDDEAHILRTLERFCRNEGIRMHGAASAVEALDLLENEAVDIVVSDYQMPGMNGLDFLAEVHSRWPSVAGIVISGFVELPAVTSALRQGIIVGFLHKPWKRDELKELIRKASERCSGSAEEGAVAS